MKVFALLILVCFVAAEAVYTTLDDHPEIVSLFNNPEKLKKEVACYLDQGPCDPISQSYKDLMPEVFATACSKCNEENKQKSKTFLTGLKGKYPHLYMSFVNKYDPQGIYIHALKKSIA